MKVVEFLFERGAKIDQTDVDGKTPLWMASQVGLFVAQLLSHILSLNMLCCLQEGHLKVVEFLLEKGAKVYRANKKGVTPLWIASCVCFCFLAFLSSKINLQIFYAGRSFESC